MTTSDNPQRPPAGPAGVSAPLPPVILVQPEVIAALDRIATAFEAVAAAVTPADDQVQAELCGAAIWRPGDTGAGLPLVCTRPAGHDLNGHVARDEDGNVIACTLGRPANPAEGWVCPACGEGADRSRG